MLETLVVSAEAIGKVKFAKFKKATRCIKRRGIFNLQLQYEPKGTVCGNRKCILCHFIHYILPQHRETALLFFQILWLLFMMFFCRPTISNESILNLLYSLEISCFGI